MEDNWKQVYMKAREALLGHGIDNTHLEFILFDMVYTGDEYTKALDFYAAWRGLDAVWLHNYLCGSLLRLGKEIGPGALLTGLKGDVKIADGVSAATGS